MTRVLVTISPLMYREAVALAVHQNRPDCDVRVAPPGAIGSELEGFRPHLLVYNDTSPIPAEVLEGVLCRVEVRYSDSMSARTIAEDASEETDDMGTEGLLRAVDLAAALAGRERTRG